MGFRTESDSIGLIEVHTILGAIGTIILLNKMKKKQKKKKIVYSKKESSFLLHKTTSKKGSPARAQGYSHPPN